jgi:ribonuclease T
MNATAITMARRFRGFLPVVVDVETGGFNSARDALLEIAAVLVTITPAGELQRGETHCYHVKPFEGANLEPASLAVNGIDPFHPLRPAIGERDALHRIFKEVRQAIRDQGCKRAILVGHNANFDLSFLNAAVLRTDIKRNPFHPFSCFDTVTLAGAALGQTVLAKAALVAGMAWDSSSAHSAAYDAERTADLFCRISNSCLPSYLEAEERARSLGWHDDVTPAGTPPAAAAEDPASEA